MSRFTFSHQIPISWFVFEGEQAKVFYDFCELEEAYEKRGQNSLVNGGISADGEEFFLCVVAPITHEFRKYRGGMVGRVVYNFGGNREEVETLVRADDIVEATRQRVFKDRFFSRDVPVAFLPNEDPQILRDEIVRLGQMIRTAMATKSSPHPR